jgi:hypothetical protein
MLTTLARIATRMVKARRRGVRGMGIPTGGGVARTEIRAGRPVEGRITRTTRRVRGNTATLMRCWWLMRARWIPVKQMTQALLTAPAWACGCRAHTSEERAALLTPRGDLDRQRV